MGSPKGNKGWPKEGGDEDKERLSQEQDIIALPPLELDKRMSPNGSASEPASYKSSAQLLSLTIALCHVPSRRTPLCLWSPRPWPVPGFERLSKPRRQASPQSRSPTFCRYLPRRDYCCCARARKCPDGIHPQGTQAKGQYVRMTSMIDAWTAIDAYRNRMLAGNAALSPSYLPSSLSRSQLHSTMTVPVRASSETELPTHILALSSSTSSGSDQVRLFPIHSLVLASHCARLPRLPHSQASSSSSQVTLPVLPMTVPSPAAFAVLHQFMYHHRLDSVLKALFPLPANFLQSLSHHTVQATLNSEPTLRQLSSYLCSSASSNLQTLTSHAAHVKELWQDMAALGLYDPELWDAIDLAWEIVLGALNLAAAGN